MDILKYLKQGLRGTINVYDSHFSYGSTWQAVESALPLDRWYQGDFASAEYTISIELGTDKKEIIKCLLTASPNEASVVVYGRASTTTDLVSVTAQVTNSYVELILSPKTDAQKGCKASFSATYFKSHT
tara:strand:+ start:3065 stop:3451 length:387 start_codon:yes stop_codon:yes gene_type:complete